MDIKRMMDVIDATKNYLKMLESKLSNARQSEAQGTQA